MNEIAFREDVRESDVLAVREITDSTGYFSPEEVGISAELVEARLSQGERSGYAFILAERGSALAGYACYGRTPGTERSWDLYWIVVAPSTQRRGLGSTILVRVESKIAAAGGGLVWVETSSTDQYASTRGFYERAGYRRAAVLDDFYREGDAKVIYGKRVQGVTP